MAIQYLKKSPKTSSTDDTKTTGIVQDLLKDIETTKEQGCIDLTKNLINMMVILLFPKRELKKSKKHLTKKLKMMSNFHTIELENLLKLN